MITVVSSKTVATEEQLDIEFPLYRKNYDGHWNAMIKITAINYPVCEDIPANTVDCLKVLYVRRDVGEIKAEILPCRPHAPQKLSIILRDFDQPATAEEFSAYSEELTRALFEGNKRT